MCEVVNLTSDLSDSSSSPWAELAISFVIL